MLTIFKNIKLIDVKKAVAGLVSAPLILNGSKYISSNNNGERTGSISHIFFQDMASPIGEQIL